MNVSDGQFYSSLKNLFNGFFGHFFRLLSNVYITGGISVIDFFAIVEIVHINVVKVFRSGILGNKVSRHYVTLS